MRVLITGATGFLGRYVVAAAVRRGHEVTALVRPSRTLAGDFFPTEVALARGDVRNAASLNSALEDVDAVIHLAACVVGDDDSQFGSTVVGTENLLSSMVQGQVTRLVHCSTFSVYDWQQPGSVLDEKSPLEENLYQRDGYAISKTWQERLVRRAADANGWQLTVLRPGFIWGAGNELIAGIGQSVGSLHGVIGGRRPLPLSYVENCADCFLTALESPDAVGETYNVIDPEPISAWQYMGDCLRSGVTRGWRLYIPYWLGISVAQLARVTSRVLFGPNGKLPGLFVPIKFRARFRPLEFPSRKLSEHLNWLPPWTYQEAWQRTESGQAKLAASGQCDSKKTESKPEDSLV